jgi:prophage regulatory protein
VIIRPFQLAARLGVSITTLWRMEKAGSLPARVKIANRAVGWRSTDIDAWMSALPESVVSANKKA